jgi:hypothetical protein
MSTRKLILTALICGLAIMMAGGAKLFLMVNEDVTVKVLDFGTSATLSDMTVTVNDVQQTESGTYVSVTMSGVAGADAQEGWRLLAGGEVLSPAGAVPVSVGVACGTTAVVNTESCHVAFGPSEGSVTVAYLRAGTQSQWAG